MKFKLIYPAWKKLERQTEFHLPPHGPIVFAAALPEDIEIEFVDENVQVTARLGLAENGGGNIGVEEAAMCIHILEKV